MAGSNKEEVKGRAGSLRLPLRAVAPADAPGAAPLH